MIPIPPTLDYELRSTREEIANIEKDRQHWGSP